MVLISKVAVNYFQLSIWGSSRGDSRERYVGPGTVPYISPNLQQQVAQAFLARDSRTSQKIPRDTSIERQTLP